MLQELNKNSTIDQIQQCAQLGAFYYKCPIDLLQAIEQAKSLFSNDLSKFTSNSNLRGYLSFGSESGSNAFESKEAYSIGYDAEYKNQSIHHTLDACNIWPNDSIQKYQSHLFNQLSEIALEIVGLLSSSLGFTKEYLQDYCRKGHEISLLRLFHYNSIEKTRQLKNNSEKITGSSEHTDWGFLTLIIAQEERKGLEICNNDEWFPIPPKTGHLIVNLGDYFSLLTRNTYSSPLHRVVLDEFNDRYSYVFFF